MDIIIIGNGGHSKVIQDIVTLQRRYTISAILDDQYEHVFEKEGKIYAPIREITNILTPKTKVIIAIGDNVTRKGLMKKLAIHESQYATIIHPTAIVSPTAKVGFGTVIMPRACINAEAIVGSHCIINTGAIVEHDVVVRNFAHISPNATLTGNVTVGEGTHIGSTATIIPQVTVGNWSIIGAGSTVITDIPSYSTAVGSPTRIVKENKKEKVRK